MTNAIEVAMLYAQIDQLKSENSRLKNQIVDLQKRLFIADDMVKELQEWQPLNTDEE